MPGLPLIYDRAPAGHMHACQAGQHGTPCGYLINCWNRKENTIGVAETVSFLVAQRAVSILTEQLRNTRSSGILIMRWLIWISSLERRPRWKAI